MNTLEQLKQNNEDFEWYPTTDEILYKMRKDIIKRFHSDKYSYHRNQGIHKNYCNDKLIIDNFLDIGAGDGRVLDYFESTETSIKNKYGIELAKTQADNLIRNNVGLIGRDYFETVLIDKYYDVVFSNPPYSIFKIWVEKLLNEINAEYIYLVMPERWIDDEALLDQIQKKGEWEILGAFDFLSAERQARAKVNLIRIYSDQYKKNTDTFTRWVEQNIGEFRENEKEIIEEKFTDINHTLSERSENVVDTLVENYTTELNHLLETYRAIAKLDFSILKALGLNKQDVIDKIKSDITTLKNKYWMQTFNHIETIKDRLTYKTRKELFDKILWFKQLDFNHNNIYTIVVWVIENFNKYTKEQLLKSFDDLTNFDKVYAYKSNEKWFDAGWRYTKQKPEKYSLDYRIVVYSGSRYNNRCYYDYDDNPAQDLAIVARSLGFDNNGVENRIERGKKYECLMKDGKVLFEFRVYQNNNVHFKLNKEFLKVFNIEVGKVKQWLHAPKDVAEEFNMKESEAEKYFYRNELQLLNLKSGKLMLTFES